METWIDYICKENNFEFDGYGVGGNGIWNTVLNFLEYEEDFDVCIFAWSEPSRAYFPLRTVSNISGDQNIKEDPRILYLISEVNEKYNKYYMDENLCMLKAITWLRWFDEFLKEYYSDKKFIHLYSFQTDFYENDKNIFWGRNTNSILAKNSQKRDLEFNFYHHTFKYGINIRPSLMAFAELFPRSDKDHGGELHMEHPVHKSFAKQLNKVLNDELLKNGDIVEFNLEY
jgi:hypothetical protein